MSNNINEQESDQVSDKIYSYNDGQKNPNNLEYDAFRRSMGGVEDSKKIEEIENKEFPMQRLGSQTSIVHIDQSPPYIWVLFLIFGLIQILFILLFGFYFSWDEKSNDPNKTNTNSYALKEIKNKYRYFQDITIMILLGFGFLRSFLKHHIWSSIVITFISGVISFEFAFLCIITWTAIINREFINKAYDFNIFFDSLYISSCYIISFGSFFGKFSFPQYLVIILAENIFASLNYILVRKKLEIIDVGGTITVHLFGAVFGCLFAIISFCNKNEIERINTSVHFISDHSSNLIALFGSLIIIPLWPSFNTALIEGNQKYRGIINTYFSIGGSIIGSFLISPILNQKKFKLEDLLYASFPGAIVIGGCCHLIKEFYLCILFGIAASVLTLLAFYLFYEKIKINNSGYHDTAKVIFYHGVPAILGGIISTIFIGNLKNLIPDINQCTYKMFICPSDSDIDNEGINNIQRKAGAMFGAIFLTLLIAGLSGLCVGFSVKFCNCNIAWRYFNDSEFFDVSGNEPFPWVDERVEFKFNYDSKPK